MRNIEPEKSLWDFNLACRSNSMCISCAGLEACCLLQLLHLLACYYRCDCCHCYCYCCCCCCCCCCGAAAALLLRRCCCGAAAALLLRCCYHAHRRFGDGDGYYTTTTTIQLRLWQILTTTSTSIPTNLLNVFHAFTVCLASLGSHRCRPASPRTS